MSREKADALGVKPLLSIKSQAVIATTLTSWLCSGHGDQEGRRQGRTDPG